jgi:hypothetical protein
MIPFDRLQDHKTARKVQVLSMVAKFEALDSGRSRSYYASKNRTGAIRGRH